MAQGNSQLTIHQLIAISNDQIHRIVNQASNLKADKIVQKEFVNLLHENGSIRRTLNEYEALSFALIIRLLHVLRSLFVRAVCKGCCIAYTLVPFGTMPRLVLLL